MSGKSTIEWTDATWNPTTGCTKVSPGCAHCYAETIAKRFKHDGPYVPWTVKAQREPGRPAVTLHPDRLDWPLKQKKPLRIFVDSMSDLFHEDVPDAFIHRVIMTMQGYWGIDGQVLEVEKRPKHIYQVLTKRPERMAEFIKVRWPHGLPPNIWLGVSVENQRYADKRIPPLLQTPAAVRFISAEPLLGPVDIDQYLDRGYESGGPQGWVAEPSIDWVIVGGESGPRARPMHPDWVGSLRDQCKAAGVPFFFKQWGQWMRSMDRPADTTSPHTHVVWSGHTFDNAYDPAHLDALEGHASYGMIRVGKGKAGALLDGREWHEFPEAKC
jgi:protein gp37